MFYPKKNLGNFALLFILTVSCPAWSFIGGSRPAKPIDGVVKIISHECTGVLVTPNVILTALHCISKSPSGILNQGNARTLSGPNFPENLSVEIVLGDQVLTGAVRAVKADLFPEFYHNRVSPLSHVTDTPEGMAEIYKIGDFALLHLEASLQPFIPDGMELPKIKFLNFDEVKPELWVGGVGYRGPMKAFQFPEEYLGSFVELSPESLVKAGLSNLKNEISFLGPGDSGGGAFLFADGSTFVVGLNHSIDATDRADLTKIEMNKETGMVVKRPAADWGQTVGNIAVFDIRNEPLRAWISENAPDALAPSQAKSCAKVLTSPSST